MGAAIKRVRSERYGLSFTFAILKATILSVGKVSLTCRQILIPEQFSAYDFNQIAFRVSRPFDLANTRRCQTRLLRVDIYMTVT